MQRSWLTVVGLVGATFGVSGLGACSDDECKSNSDCPTGRICRLGLCALDPNQVDGTTSDTLGPDVPLNCDPATAADLVLNEILADPPAGADPDGNGIPSTTEDEFVEVVNVSARAVAMTNVQIDVNGKKVVLGTTCLPANQARVVFGSSGLPSLTNSGASVSLVVDGTVAQSHTYGSEGGDDQSLTLSPQLDRSGLWVRAGDTFGLAFSPGKCSDGADFPNCGSGPPPDGDVETVDGEIVAACSTAPIAGDLVINEIMADPGSNDANGDGTPSNDDDEYIEIVNVGSATLLLDGVKIRDAGNATYTFPAATCVAPNQAVVVFSKYAGTGSFPGVITLGNLGFAINNSQETITIVDALNTTLATVSTGSLGGADQAIVRSVDLDPTAAFVNHSAAPNAGGRMMSPGFCQSGAAFPNCSLVVVEDNDVVEGPSEVVDDVTTTEVTSEVVEEVGPTCGPVATAADLVINEVLLDPPDGYDANGDGTASVTQDELVEIVNVGDGAVSLDGLKVWDSAELKYSIPSGVCLEPHEALVVFGKGAQLFKSEGKTDVDTTSHLLDLNNSGDTVQIKTTAGDVVLTQAFAQGNDQSWTRSPDLGVNFVLHKSVNAALAASPGRCVDGELMPACLAPPQ
ncbi:MAG: lamin tail domain-containing protein [Deltaproteobacteria bacterium]|nr:lamin tail domain-containing protein [Deltaproteobacteria bacterium]